MKTIIILNIIAGILYFILLASVQRYYALALVVMYVDVLPLGFLCYNIYLWRTKREACGKLAMVPCAIFFAFSAAFLGGGVGLVAQALYKHTPVYPLTFLTEENEAQMDQLAERLLQEPFTDVYPNGVAELKEGTPYTPVPEDLLEAINTFGFKWTSVDHKQEMVTFQFIKPRNMDFFIYSTKPLAENPELAVLKDSVGKAKVDEQLAENWYLCW